MSNTKHHAPAMSFEQFVGSIDKLVWKWSGAEHGDSITPRDALKAIYDEVRNSTAYQLAQMQSERDKAVIALHKHYTKERNE
jgi:hypothetical protein